jgi:hypothetical protein
MERREGKLDLELGADDLEDSDVGRSTKRLVDEVRLSDPRLAVDDDPSASAAARVIDQAQQGLLIRGLPVTDRTVCPARPHRSHHPATPT